MLDGINIAVEGFPLQASVDALSYAPPGWADKFVAGRALDLRQFELPGSAPEGISSGLPSQLLHAEAEADLLLVESCPSTMDMAAELAEQGALPAWGAVLAVRQPGGIGQMRRSWVSAPGNLHASFLLPGADGFDPFWNRLLPLVYGHCVRIGLRRLGAKVELKWPNDIVQFQKTGPHKTCGLLIQDRGGRIVAGCGMNLTTAPPPQKMRKGAAFPAGILEFDGRRPSALELWPALVNQMKKEYQALLEHTTPPDFIARLSQELLWMGEHATLHEGESRRIVTLLGLAPDGGLRICGEEGETVIYSGSISKDFTADVRP